MSCSKCTTQCSAPVQPAARSQPATRHYASCHLFAQSPSATWQTSPQSPTNKAFAHRTSSAEPTMLYGRNHFLLLSPTSFCITDSSSFPTLQKIPTQLCPTPSKAARTASALMHITTAPASEGTMAPYALVLLFATSRPESSTVEPFAIRNQSSRPAGNGSRMACFELHASSVSS